MRYWMSLLALVASVGTAQAEMYVAVQGGVNFPKSLSNVQGMAGNVPVMSSDLTQQTSAMYGGKIGYYFEGWSWLGVQTEVYRTTPNLSAQTASVTTPGVTGSIPASDHSMIVWSPFMVQFRVPSGTFSVPVEPYAGIGFGVFFSSLSLGGFSNSSTDIGFTSNLGLRYRITQNWAAFGEWKYNNVNLNQQFNVLGIPIQGNATYSAHILAFGIGYHFSL